MPVGKKRPLKTVALVVDGKVKQLRVARVELRTGGDLHRLAKPGWSAGSLEK